LADNSQADNGGAPSPAAPVLLTLCEVITLLFDHKAPVLGYPPDSLIPQPATKLPFECVHVGRVVKFRREDVLRFIADKKGNG
jgi:hypothetical protein